MPEKQCANCGDLNPPDSNYCSNCGSSDFGDVPTRLTERLAEGTEPARSPAVRINTDRVIFASLLSAGLYLVYWFYLTWKQLATETNERHYPVWHALTLLVPLYSLYRMHEHARVIRELAAHKSITSTVAPGLAVVLLGLSAALDWSSFRVTDYATLIVLSIVTTLLTTTLIVTAQGGLNRYWERVWPDTLTDARVGVGEVVLVGVGLIIWILILIPPSALE